MNQELSTLRLYQLTSPSLPIGAFTYSQGMEWAVEAAWLDSPQTVKQWLTSVMSESLAWLELPLFIRLYEAASSGNKESFNHWSQLLLASRETNELRQEEMQRARAFLMVLGKLPDASAWPELLAWRESLLRTQLAGFTLASSKWQIGCRAGMSAYTWSWLDNAINVAIKLVPLGQSDGQVLLHALSEKIPSLLDRAYEVTDDEIGASTPALAIASSLHETQYTRLFRS